MPISGFMTSEPASIGITTQQSLFTAALITAKAQPSIRVMFMTKYGDYQPTTKHQPQQTESRYKRIKQPIESVYKVCYILHSTQRNKGNAEMTKANTVVELMTKDCINLVLENTRNKEIKEMLQAELKWRINTQLFELKKSADSIRESLLNKIDLGAYDLAAKSLKSLEVNGQQQGKLYEELEHLKYEHTLSNS